MSITLKAKFYTKTLILQKMNKENLVKLTQQVLSEIDEEMLDEQDKYLRMVLCNKLRKVFSYAAMHCSGSIADDKQKAYQSVKPILDDALQSYKDNKDEDILSEGDLSQLEEQKYHDY